LGEREHSLDDALALVICYRWDKYPRDSFAGAIHIAPNQGFSANSKIPSTSSTFPNAIDGEISGWELAEGQNEQGFAFLRDREDKMEINDQMNARIDLLSGFSVVELEIKGATTIEKLLYGIYLGDYISLYLALLNEIDPSTNESVAFIESKLTETDKTE